MKNAEIEIADVAVEVDVMRREFEAKLEKLREQQADLASQLSLLEKSLAALGGKPAPPVAPAAVNPPPVPKADEEISEELMLVISAAVAAFLGKSARVRAAHYVHEGTSPWAQQGRVFVQASHALGHHSYD